MIVYWPGLDNNIDNIILACKQCQLRTYHHQTQTRTSISGTCSRFLILCLTGFPHLGGLLLSIIHMGHNTTTSQLKRFLPSRKISASWGCQISFGQTKDHSSPLNCLKTSPKSGGSSTSHHPHARYPQSNGKTEATEKSMKKLIEASWMGTRLDEGKLARVLLQYRNTSSCRDGLSPAQKLFGDASNPPQSLLPRVAMQYGRS